MADIKTIQPNLSEAQQTEMLALSSKNLCWLAERQGWNVIEKSLDSLLLPFTPSLGAMPIGLEVTLWKYLTVSYTGDECKFKDTRRFQ